MCVTAFYELRWLFPTKLAGQYLLQTLKKLLCITDKIKCCHGNWKLHICFFTVHAFFYKQGWTGKNYAMQSNTPKLNFCYLKIIHILHLCYHPKMLGHILKNKQTIKCVCIHEIIWLIIMNMKKKMKNISHRYDINRPSSIHGYKCSKDKKCLSMMML